MSKIITLQTKTFGMPQVFLWTNNRLYMLQQKKYSIELIESSLNEIFEYFTIEFLMQNNMILITENLNILTM